MKRIFCLIFVFVLAFAVVSCSGKKKKEIKPDYEEQVTQEISAEEGGTVKNSDESVSIEIPAAALDEDKTITMTIYDAKGYVGTEGRTVVSKVVEFEPSGTVFKKPVIIRMAATESFEDKIVTAAVYRDEKGEWSYSEHGAYAVLAGRDAAGDPIMQSAAGDPIMLNAAGDPIMTNAAGDPIMMAAAGDPIMLASAGDPIMTSAAGDPIMNAAAGDPIMMTTGHFTAYSFFVITPKEPVEEPDEEAEDDELTDEDGDIDMSDIEISEDDDEPVADEDETPDADEDEEIIPEPDPVYSKVLCTGQKHCSSGRSVIDCPERGEEFYGQDAQHIGRKSCVPHKFTKVEAAESAEGEGETPTGEDLTVYFDQVVDENTGLRWVLLNEEVLLDAARERCENLEYGGFDDWRLPTAKEFLSISDHDRVEPALNPLYFNALENRTYWTGTPAVSFGREDEFVGFDASYGGIRSSYSAITQGVAVVCVRGDEYGRVSAENYEDGGETVFDSATGLVWQKASVSGKDWNGALSYCESLTLAGKSDWRLPNKNELMTLIDYSKSEPASIFPGMTSETLWSSTFNTYYGGTNGLLTVKTGNGMIDYDYNSTELSVRCVRSDTEPAGGIPLCDASGAAPCEDPATHYVWSRPDFPYASSRSWESRAEYCLDLNQGGISKWRMPTIDEVRTLLTASDKLKTGGECKVTDACSDYKDEMCFTYETCANEEEIGTGFESSLGDYGYLISGTLTFIPQRGEESDYMPWAVNLENGSLDLFYGGSVKSNSRCIKDDSLPDAVSFPYTDSENRLVWSSRSEDSEYWYGAAQYCHDLVEGGSNNWRVPTIDELRTLVRNCTDGECEPDVAGKYSLFGEISSLWSSTVETETYGDYSYSYLNILNFMTAVEGYSSPDYYDLAKVRCVRGLDESETETEFEFPFEVGDVIWSKVSESEMSMSDAEQYCASLNEEGYDGRTNWEVPDHFEVASLIKKSVCLNKDDFMTQNVSDGLRCDHYTFDGYSIFGDMFQLIANDGYAFNFVSGEIYHSDYTYGYVRCVAVLPDAGA